MNRVEQLICTCCPLGVPRIPLGELGQFLGGLTGKSKEDFVDGNAKLITYKNVYSNPALDIDVADKVKIAPHENQRTLQYGDVIFTGSSETPDECGLSSVLTVKTGEKLYLNSFCFIFRFHDPDIMLPDFSKHLFRSSEVRKEIVKTANGVTRYNVSKKLMGQVRIPVPPIEVQREIVRILDRFSELAAELTAELTAELAARKEQYQYYLDSFYGGSMEGMKAFDGLKQYQLVTLRSLGTLTRGKRFVHADATERGAPCIHYGELYTYYGVAADRARSFISPEQAKKLRFAHKGDIVIVGAGENRDDIGVGVAWYGEEDVVVHDACYIFRHQQNPKYISYFLRTGMYHQQIKKYVSEGKICAVSADGIGRALIPVPSLKEQERIVSVLDRLCGLSSDIEVCLSAEIEARQRQYEYYRDKLLIFQEQQEAE